MYILFSIFALLAVIGSIYFDKLVLRNSSWSFTAFVKAAFVFLVTFFIVAILGNVNKLYNFDWQYFVYFGVIAAFITVGWVFYFIALKKAEIEEFGILSCPSLLLINNILFSFFFLSSLTNGNKVVNLVFYFLGLALLLAGVLFMFFNKKLDLKSNKLYLIFTLIASLGFALGVFFYTKTDIFDIGNVPSLDIVFFHIMSVVTLVTLIICLIKKDIHKPLAKNYNLAIKHLISDCLGSLVFIFGYRCVNEVIAITTTTANLFVVVNMIICFEFAVFAAYKIFFKKDKPFADNITLFIILLSGVIFSTLAGVI